MIIIRNKFIPFGGYKAINIFGILFVKKNTNIDNVTINHEKIHTKQIIELLFIFFYIWYGIELLIRYIINKKTAYKNILFEKEAYFNEKDLDYLNRRKPYSWLIKKYPNVS
jgi:hypothetical protein